MSEPSETFDLPPVVRALADAITQKYRLSLALQMTEELVDAGVPMPIAFHITVGELCTAAARVAMTACAIEEREPRRDLWIQRSGEVFDDAKHLFADLKRQGDERTDPETGR
ncbi:hypothetical protein ABIA24_001766 [Sinorhizobium fredii]|uniref:hypothetical protein n=1 Tax=Rhizobium fredii TaxID=380 RepID=UPI003517B320